MAYHSWNVRLSFDEVFGHAEILFVAVIAMASAASDASLLVCFMSERRGYNAHEFASKCIQRTVFLALIYGLLKAAPPHTIRTAGVTFDGTLIRAFITLVIAGGAMALASLGRWGLIGCIMTCPHRRVTCPLQNWC